MSDYTFLWGKKEASVSFLAEWNVETLLPPLNKQQAANEKQLVTRALEKPYGPRLEQIARPGLPVVVVISDHSRAWQQPKIFLPLIIERMNI